MPPRKAPIDPAKWPEIALMAERVQQARIEKEMTQEDLARRLEIDRAWITNLENRKVSPQLQSLISVARALDKPLTYFFDPAPPKR